MVNEITYQIKIKITEKTNENEPTYQPTDRIREHELQVNGVEVEAADTSHIYVIHVLFPTPLCLPVRFFAVDQASRFFCGITIWGPAIS